MLFVLQLKRMPVTKAIVTNKRCDHQTDRQTKDEEKFDNSKTN